MRRSPARLVAPALRRERGDRRARSRSIPASGRARRRRSWRCNGARAGSAIPGATGRAFVPAAGEDGAELDCLVTATNAGGSVALAAGADPGDARSRRRLRGRSPTGAESRAARRGGWRRRGISPAGRWASRSRAPGRGRCRKRGRFRAGRRASRGGGGDGHRRELGRGRRERLPGHASRPGCRRPWWRRRSAGAGRSARGRGRSRPVERAAPAPELALQWRAGGVAIPGATAASFVPAPGRGRRGARLPGDGDERRRQRGAGGGAAPGDAGAAGGSGRDRRSGADPGRRAGAGGGGRALRRRRPRASRCRAPGRRSMRQAG